MTKTHKIYIPFNWKRTKKLTFAFILINASLLFLILNSHGIFLTNVRIESELNGYFAKHQLESTINSSAWLPKLSFLVLQLDKKSNRIPNNIHWEASSEDFSGFTLDKYWTHYEAKSKQVLIPYLILPGRSMRLSVKYEEIAHSSLQLPQLTLEEGQQRHRQEYKILVDSRYQKVEFQPKAVKHTPYESDQDLRYVEISIITGQPSPKLSWEYKQTLRTIGFMG